MGKSSRREHRRARPRLKDVERAERAAAARRVKVAVVTAPRSMPNVAKELELARATILYADEIEIVSPVAAMLAGVAAIGSLEGGAGLAAVFNQLDDATVRTLGTQSGMTLDAAKLTALKPVVSLPGESLRLLPGGQAVIDARSQFTTVMNGLVESSGAAEFASAIEAGVLSISASGLADAAPTPEALTTAWVEQIRQLLREPRTRLLFDADVAELIRAMVREGQVDPHALALKHAGEAAVGSGLVARLPAFPGVPLDELMDMRSDLGGPLVRYRAAVAELAQKLTFRSFDRESAAEIDDLWLSKVEPALADVRAGLADHSLAREAWRRLGSIQELALGLTGPGIAVALGAMTSVSGWVQAVAAVTTPAAAIAGLERQRRDARAEFERHELFYLYELDRRL